MNMFSDFIDTIRYEIGRLFSPKRSVTEPLVGGTASRLYVGNLSYSAKEEDLKGLFARYGIVLTVDIIRDRITRKLKGYAFVEMPARDAQKALELNGNEFLGRKLIVSEARSKAPEVSSSSSSRRPRRQGRRRQGGRSQGEKPKVERLE